MTELTYFGVYAEAEEAFRLRDYISAWDVIAGSWSRIARSHRWWRADKPLTLTVDLVPKEPRTRQIGITYRRARLEHAIETDVSFRLSEPELTVEMALQDARETLDRLGSEGTLLGDKIPLIPDASALRAKVLWLNDPLVAGVQTLRKACDLAVEEDEVDHEALEELMVEGSWRDAVEELGAAAGTVIAELTQRADTLLAEHFGRRTSLFDDALRTGPAASHGEPGMLIVSISRSTDWLWEGDVQLELGMVLEAAGLGEVEELEDLEDSVAFHVRPPEGAERPAMEYLEQYLSDHVPGDKWEIHLNS